VTRLAEFSLIGRFFTFGIVFKNTEVVQIQFGLLFSCVLIMYVIILAKKGWVTFWAIFSLKARLPDGLFSNQKIPIWVNF
jgi:hypothetical protein